MIFLAYIAIKMTLKVFWWALIAELWMCWALVALPVTLIASLTGNSRTARQWQRSLNWQRTFRL